ncbi:MAG TPA: hypothetical protein DEG63_06205 [Flavobacteriaceae bacterium]|nr:hypothetical protein [Flavobacteriaceae bacterium]
MKKFYSSVAVAALSTLSFGQNLVVNSGFETGSLSPWAAGTGSGYTEPTVSNTGAHSGTYSAIYNATATTGFFQNVAVTGGKTYVIEFWYKADASGGRIWSIYKDKDGKPVYTTDKADTDSFRTLNKFLPAVAEWTKHTVEMPAHANATSLDVAFRAYEGKTASFDDILAYEKGTLAISDVDFKNKVKMNTLITDKLVIDLPVKSTVNIYTVDGKLVSSNRVEVGSSINTQSLSKGVYLVSVDNGTTKVTQKVVKK